VPGFAVNDTCDCVLPGALSLQAICASALTAFPVNTASTVSKLLPNVSTVTVPLVVCGVNVYHTVRPYVTPLQLTGSPGSVVAARVTAVCVFGRLGIAIAFAKLSFGGGAVGVKFTTRLPKALPNPPTWMR